MIRVHLYQSTYIQQWNDKFSYRDHTGQWYEFDSLAKAQEAIDNE
jgi:hypothetical protein